MSAAPSVVVTGDLTVDWTIVTRPDIATNLQLAYLWDQPGTAPIAALPGGAALIANLLGELDVAATLSPATPPAALSDPRQTGIARSFSAWSSLPASRGSAEGRWRLREFLGQVPAAKSPVSQPVPGAPVVVIDDSNLGFRSASGDWDSILAGLAGADDIVVRMASPIACGPLWDHLSATAGQKVTLVCTLGDLRKEDAAVGQALSWERTASEIVAAVRSRADLARARRVVVSIGLAGAVIVEANAATLIYDPKHLEGDWEARHLGMTFGTGAALVASIAEAVHRGAEVSEGVTRGVAFGRAIHERGLEIAPDGDVRLHRDHGGERASGSASIERQPVPSSPEWTLLAQRAEGDLAHIANETLVNGIEASTSGIPVERMGAWTSIDRAEIESIRGVRNIVREYLELRAARRPLSIAVFGPPGSGKSFAIKEMAADLGAGARALRTLEFNLSQFEGPHTLAAAFQQVRDCTVEGVLPVVFWDEFDTPREGAELGWLSSFLAPMQDGVFLDGALSRPIGPALFVFAGGTHATVDSFKARAPLVPAAKATDFGSRLRGFVDVRGPNRGDAGDASFAIRRALLLRQVLARRAPQLFQSTKLNIDPGVANAFLAIDRYVHGARSLEAIVEMSALTGRTRFGRSSLPAAHQLALHVDASEFLGIVEAKYK